MQVTNNYIAHIDSKKRITLRKSKDISNKALEVMDSAVANYKKGKVSAPVDLFNLPN